MKTFSELMADVKAVTRQIQSTISRFKEQVDDGAGCCGCQGCDGRDRTSVVVVVGHFCL